MSEPLKPIDILFPERRIMMKNGMCPVCRGEAMTFKDDISRREAKISGLCQKCQDDVFNSTDEEE